MTKMMTRAEAEAEIARRLAVLRQRMLTVPASMRARCPDLPDAAVNGLDLLIRIALAEIEAEAA